MDSFLYLADELEWKGLFRGLLYIQELKIWKRDIFMLG